MKLCKIDGCGNKSGPGRGWCNKHYKRWQIHGDPLKVARTTWCMPLAARLAAQYMVNMDSGCWEWNGRLSIAGYGQIKDNYRTRHAHRVSWEIHRGEIPIGLLVCHRCDNRKCVNPDHLFLGTDRDNRQDCLMKDRANMPSGDNHWSRRRMNAAGRQR